MSSIINFLEFIGVELDLTPKRDLFIMTCFTSVGIEKNIEVEKYLFQGSKQI
jgi:hypothetical protein